MKTYHVIKRVNLQVGQKTYRKGATITAEMVGQDKINRYLARGYIKPIGAPHEAAEENTSPCNSSLPFYINGRGLLNTGAGGWP